MFFQSKKQLVPLKLDRKPLHSFLKNERELHPVDLKNLMLTNQDAIQFQRNRNPLLIYDLLESHMLF